ncbi:MAG: hypothetical protein PF961_13215 [Planctomycetota bacterium]|jgi:hypothetical protein|nr:hypothetical protein [Planctomycetota bacterium]
MTIVAIVVSVLSLGLAVVVARGLAERARIARGLVIGATLALVLWVVLGQQSLWVARLIPGPYLLVLGEWLPLIAALVCGAAWSAMKTPAWRRVALLGPTGAAAIIVAYLPLLSTRPPCDNFWQHGVCIQTTPSTCTAAAAATLLARKDLHHSEAELVAACATTKRGTLLHGAIGGLRAFAKQHRVCFDSFDHIDDVPLPAILSVVLTDELDARDPRYRNDWGWIINQPHSVILLAIEPDGRPLIADPAIGIEHWDQTGLTELWTGRAIWLADSD